MTAKNLIVSGVALILASVIAIGGEIYRNSSIGAGGTSGIGAVGGITLSFSLLFILVGLAALFVGLAMGLIKLYKEKNPRKYL
jgi:hypothetical protein